jgi:cytochrome P450
MESSQRERIHMGTGVRPAELSDEEWALRSFDPWDRERLRYDNAWRIYGAMRRQGPAIHSDAFGYLWSLTRYSDIKAATLDYKTFSNARGNKIGRTHPSDPPGTPLEYDPPMSTKFRTAMIAPFVPRRIGQFDDLVRGHVDAILDRAAAQASVDVVTDIAEPLAVNVISDIIGFDDEGRRRNREHSKRVVLGTNAALKKSNDGYNEFLRDQIRRAMQEPRPGMLGELATALRDGTSEFSLANVTSMMHAMGLAGHHTTINAISAMMIRTADPELRSRWLPSSTSARVESFAEEVLRIDPPIHLEGRWTTKPVVVGGTEIPADSQVALLYASANHDEEQFPDPERFDASRTTGHLTFGHGVHTCLGMALARLEMKVLLEQVLERFATVELAGLPVDTGMVYGHHMGWESVPVTLA